MKRVLFMINSLTIGGSEKSLVSLLNSLDYSKIEVDLIMLKIGEEFDKFIPKEVHVLEPPKYYGYIFNKVKLKKLKEVLTYRSVRYKCSLDLRLNRRRKIKLNDQQILYNNQKYIIENLDKIYDVAIAYAQGFPTYFIADKVKAKKKLAWINCDYTATLYDKRIDKVFYDRIDKIIAVSEWGKQSIINVNKDYEKKIEIIKDIVNPKLIEKMAKEEINEFDESEINILTVARLVLGYKGYDLAIKAAKLMKDTGYKFKWYAIGDGPDRKKIKSLINELGLEENFILLGAKENPYPYMKSCDIYVQPSRKEGFGLTVIEAKILKKKIVCTNFNTSSEIIANNINGVICNMNHTSIFESIKKYIDNNTFSKNIELNLFKENQYNSTGEIKKIYEFIKVK